MSTYSKITDEEMQYFQFKARQNFLVRKEDHDWNEFCKKNRCTCCACQPTENTKSLKEVGIQVNAKKTTTQYNRNTNVNPVQVMRLPDSIEDIKDKLEKISLTLSEMKHIPLKDNEQNFEITSTDSELMQNSSTLNFFNEQKKNSIKNSLLKSLQRLHLFANQRSTKPLEAPYIKNSSFFLPHNLKKQRMTARKAYLDSLVNKPKILNKKVMFLKNKKDSASKQISKSIQSAAPKTRGKKSTPITKPIKKQTIVETEKCETKDENIENVLDNILDDILGEELLALNRIRQVKLKKLKDNFPMEKNSNTKCFKTETKASKRIHLSQFSPETRAKIKQNPFFNFKNEDQNNSSFEIIETSNSRIKNSTQELLQNIPSYCDMNVQLSCKSNVKTEDEINNSSNSKNYRTLFIDPKLVKSIEMQRKLYWKHLKKMSRTKTFNFDPVALSNMVAESLLDDCLTYICEELGDIPSSVITDLYNQEFTPVLI